MIATVTATPIFSGEPVRYHGRDRQFWNNGFRRRWLAQGARNAQIINAARRGDLDTVLAYVATMAGASAQRTIAKSIVKAAQRLPADVPGHRILRDDHGMMVFTPHVTWQFKYSRRGESRQVGVIEWWPMFGARRGA
jgi:hypothetical protein